MRAMRQALNSNVAVLRRGDGKPETGNNVSVSAAHSGMLTLAVAGPELVACDVAQVSQLAPEVWQELLGQRRYTLAELLARNAKEEMAIAATRVWSACECLRKVGILADAPLLFVSAEADGWVLLSSGSSVMATYAARMQRQENLLILTVLAERNNARV